MFKYSQREECVNRNKPKIELRNRPKVKMKLTFTRKDRVLKSPYYLCNKLWDQLDYNIQCLTNIYEFTLAVCKLDFAIMRV